MEILILIALIVIAYSLWDIKDKLKHTLENKAGFDPDFPIYSSDEIQQSQTKIKESRKLFEEQDQKYNEYLKTHEEVKKIKKNIDQPKEFKDIMYLYHKYWDEWDDEVKKYRMMIDANYEVRNGKKTYSHAIDEATDTSKIVSKVMARKNSHDEWLKYEKQ